MKQLDTCKILLVDDTKTNIDVLIQTLKDDYKLGVALNGKKAMEYARTQKPDLILLDILMPGMSGFEVCGQLKKERQTADIPIIFITAMDSPGDKTRGFEKGAVDYIIKPFDVTEVKARVKTHLSLRIALEALENQNILLEQKVKERTRELEETQIEILERLGLATEYRDVFTGDHIKRMSNFCRLLAQACGMSANDCEMLAHASTMHDVGKIGIADAILIKAGKLTPEERKIMQTHCDIGEKMLSGSDHPLMRMAAIIAKTHHEKWDGTGYPDGLKGQAIPIHGRIACICDVFDALISVRPYKKAWPLSKAYPEIQAGSETYFDPELVNLFMKNSSGIEEIIMAFNPKK